MYNSKTSRKSNSMTKRLEKYISIATVVCMIFTCVFTFSMVVPVNANNTIYYVSSSGSDANNGTSTSTPWQTLSKVNSFNFSPGDQILFQCGNMWSGQLSIHNSGTSGSPIKVGAYGTGNKPLINAGGANTAAILINDVDYVTVDGFAVTNFDGSNISDGAEGRRNGIKIVGSSNYIVVKNNEVYYVEGYSNNPNASPAYSPRGTTFDPAVCNMYMVGAIFQEGDGSSNFTIENNYIHDNTCNGILATRVSSGLIITNNTVNNTGADGIEWWSSTNALVEYNSVVFAGNNSGTATQGSCIGAAGLAVCAIWGYASTDSIQQYNYAENTQRIKYDGQAWDFDVNTVRGIYQYNFSRENEGGFILGGGSLDKLCRYNISYNDGTDEYVHYYGRYEQGFFSSTCSFYNNTFYQDNGKGYTFGNSCAGDFKNNIFYTNCTDTTYTNYQGGSRTFSYNDFSGGQTALNMGSNAITGDPLFVDTGNVGYNIGSVAGLKLQSGSPCVNSGISISNNGGKDFWGTTLYNGNPDIGANEYITDEVINNPGFESGTTSWSGLGALIAVTTSQKYAGANGLSVTARTANWCRPYQSLVTNLAARGQGNYNVEVWVKPVTGTMNFHLEVFANDAIKGTTTTVACPSTEWTKVSGTVNVTWSGTLTQADIRLISGSGQLGDYYLDGFSMKRQ